MSIIKTMSTGESTSITTSLAKIDTPFLLIDKAKFDTNVAFLRAKLAPHNVILRPHLKTIKSIAGAKHILEGFDSPATVSTVKEAEVFADAGYTRRTTSRSRHYWKLIVMVIEVVSNLMIHA
ncbi:hypothetical protein ACPSKX_19400 [Moritella viscosa]